MDYPVPSFMLDHCNRLLFFVVFFLSAIGSCNLSADFDGCGEESNLFNDLLIVNYWNQRLAERFPTTFNHLLQGGYFSMPSARMGDEGEVAVGYGYVHPYIHYNVRFQLTNFLEITGSYRIFKGVDDPVLTPMGFGDYSDKGANVKLAIFTPEDSRYRLPGLAVGMEDFMGTCSFKAYYAVLTQVFLEQNMEVSIGYGANRIRGFFGGMLWMPFRKTSWKYLQNLSFALEYDAIPYRDEFIEKHPKGRIKNTPWHIGAKYRIFDSIDLSLCYIRGEKFAFTVSTFYNFGYTKGFLPKIDDVLPYKAPVNNEPIGCLRPEDLMIQDFSYALRCQGFDLTEAWLSDECGDRVLRLYVTNMLYRQELLVLCRLNAILSSLIPDNVDKIIVVINTLAMPIQEYHYDAKFLRMYQNQEIGSYELDTVTPMKEVSYPNFFCSKLLFKKEREWLNFEVLPRTQTVFGSSRGKFKYSLGLTLCINGFLFNDLYYSIQTGCFFLSNMKKLSDVDRINPSQLVNVRTDIINYYREKTLMVDEAYIEKVWNFRKGWYGRITLGLLEIEYGGVGAEWLYYPVNSNWAIGMSGAIVKKRTVTGIGLTDKARKLHGFVAHYVKFLGTQAFLNLYYDWKCTGLLFKVSAGKFLANDYGVRTEISRYFPSGLRLGFWYTYTNAHDVINGQTYHDKGIFFSVPLDIFYTKTSRTRWGYGMSAWLRDVGASAYSGTELYEMIAQERQ
ncbi:MAG: YjbH domain-containing protein [Chlamydiales bacterium]|nr:YjbH domain-containing protein [Chlamydiales bacterium]